MIDVDNLRNAMASEILKDNGEIPEAICISIFIAL